jgi:RNA polymerase sigma factor (sigma-70 family)
MPATACPVDERVLGHIGEVAELYARSAGLVRCQVRSGVTAPEAVIDDACQFAWSRLVHHRDRVSRDRAISWLVTTAVHEAFKLIRRASREVSLERLVDEAGDQPLSRAEIVAAPQETVERRLRLEVLGSLPERQQRLVWLQGLGFNYAEMATETGVTERTVERQLTRARDKLRLLEDAG